MNLNNILNKQYSVVETYVLSLDLKKIIRKVLILSVLIALVGGYLWYSRLYLTNERRFWYAINNSMSTQSVTRTLKSGGTGNEVVQKQQLFFAPQMVSRSSVSYAQKSATVDTSVETEGISFPGAQYSRYVAFETNQIKEDGSQPDLNDILGKWEATIASEEESETSTQNYISELVTLAVFGNFDAAFRHDVISQLKNNDAYRLNTTNIVEDERDGRTVIIYPVSIALKTYVSQLQRAFVEAGYGEFPPLNPENYREDSRINAQFVIDKKSNSIVEINFGERQEAYSGYGVYVDVMKPEAEFSSGELEAIVQEEIQSAL